MDSAQGLKRLTGSSVSVSVQGACLATFIPASASSNSFSRLQVAGPMVHTILVLRMFSYVSSTLTSELRSSSVRACGRDLRRWDVRVMGGAMHMRVHRPGTSRPPKHTLVEYQVCNPSHSPVASAGVSVKDIRLGEQGVHVPLLGLPQ